MAQTDPFRGSNTFPNWAPRKAQAVDISTTDFTPNNVTKKLFVGTPGTLVVVMADDSPTAPTTIPNVPVGFHDLQIKTIVSAGTTAQNMVAFFG